LEAALAAAAQGNRIIVVVHGEAGIGKTRLLTEFRRTARQSGARTLLGRCSEAVETPSLWPWSQIIDAYLEGARGEQVEAVLQSYGAPIAIALPGLRARVAGDPPDYLEPAHARFRAFDSLARFVATAARTEFLVVEIEDIHCADEASLRVMELLAYAPSDVRLLIVATFRDFDASGVERLTRPLAALRGSTGYEEITLGPLGPAESRTLCESVWGERLPETVVEPLLARAKGNPLFLIELARSCGATGSDWDGAQLLPSAPSTLPARILDVLDRRLAGLPAHTLRALEVASAIGRDFGAGEVARVTGEAPSVVLDALSDAIQRRLLVEMEDGPGRYRFSHALVRDRLYERQCAQERSRVHRKIATALEAFHAGDPEGHLSEIADHYARAALDGGHEQALEWVVRAADDALKRHACEEAARRFLQALALWELGPMQDEALRCSLLIGLGAASLDSGASSEATERMGQAVAIALRLCESGDARAPDLLARAVLEHFRGLAVHGKYDKALVDLLTESHARVGRKSPFRVQLTARLAIAHYWSDKYEKCERLSGEAVRLARRVGDDDALCHALHARHYVMLGRTALTEQLTVADELIRLAERRRNVELALAGRLWRIIDRVGLDQLAEARADFMEYRDRAEALRIPVFCANALVLSATFATLEGRLAEGETLAMSAFETGRRANSGNAEHYLGIQLMMLARLTGREANLIDQMRTFIERLPAIPAWRAALAAACARSGRAAEARRELETLAVDGFSGVRRDANFLVAATLLADTCIQLRDRALGRVLYRLMLPFSGCGVVIAHVAGYLGVVPQYLGGLAALSGDLNTADRWFADAIARYEASGAKPFVAETLVARAAAWVEARSRIPAERLASVQRMLESAAAIAADVGMPVCMERANALLAALASDPSTPGREPRGDEDHSYVLRQEGDYWVVGASPGSVRLRDSKGLRYLAELLRAPGRDIHVLDLLTADAASGPRGPAEKRVEIDGVDAAPLLDARARAAYRDRVAELRADLELAEAENDTGRSAAIRGEIERIGDALARTLGLGGRDRRMASAAERARINITRSIHAVLDKLAATEPRLARHLRASVTTGRFCRYDPGADGDYRWVF
jgi:hypothetical protein